MLGFDAVSASTKATLGFCLMQAFKFRVIGHNHLPIAENLLENNSL
jgi:hypothetical protein